MGYRLKPGRPVAAEATRLARKHLERASADLTAAGARLRRDRLHRARKRVKKIRAIVRLVKPSFDRATYRTVDKRLQRVGHQLGRIADSAAAVETFDRIASRHRREISRSTATALRRALKQRDALIRRAAAAKKIRAKSVHVLLAEGRRSRKWRLRVHGSREIAAGLDKSVRRARKAMHNASRHPDAARVHAWRRRVKTHWLQQRLVDDPGDRRAAALRRRLERLDGLLGQHHDLALVRRALERDESLSRDRIASTLRVIARERRRLRLRAETLGAAIYKETRS